MLHLSFATPAIVQDRAALSSLFVLGSRGDFGRSASFIGSSTGKLRKGLTLMRLGDDRKDSGEEPPESLFMKELKRRGISPVSNNKQSGSNETNTKVEKPKGLLSSGGAQSSEPSVKISQALFGEASQVDQRKQSMALNSEGLEGLIPRAQALLHLGGTFFLSFWPLIISSLTVFVALYIYYGPIFIHSGSRTEQAQGRYVDPYELLNEKRIPSELGPSLVPFSQR